MVDRAQCKLWRKAVPANGRSSVNPEKVCDFVVCGKPLPDHELKVVDDEGRVLGERGIGRILVKGPSLMAGYFGDDDATRSVMRDDGFMDTGDMGYLIGGEIVITGRAKDLILHNGRNIWPQDIEWTVERVAWVRAGDVAAIAVETADGRRPAGGSPPVPATGREEHMKFCAAPPRPQCTARPVSIARLSW